MLIRNKNYSYLCEVTKNFLESADLIGIPPALLNWNSLANFYDGSTQREMNIEVSRASVLSRSVKNRCYECKSAFRPGR